MKALTLRKIPDELYERLQERAKHDRRSMASEVLVLIERALEASPERVQEALAYFRARTGRQQGLAHKLLREDRAR